MAIGFPVKDNYVTGEVLTAANMNDLSGTLNTLAGAEYAAGKNKIINGDFGIWQRGTTFNPGNGAFTADRFTAVQQGTGTATTSQQTFTPGTAPVSGYESAYFLRMANASGTTYCELSQKIEDVRVFAASTVTFSFWAKATSSITMQLLARQSFGTGGSTQVDTTGSTAVLTSSWARYSITITLPSISGKTIGSGSSLGLFLYSTAGTVASNTVDTWGWQLELGSTATAFQTATGTIQGELAACQRYYYRFGGENTYTSMGIGMAYSSTNGYAYVQHPVTMRTAPSTTVEFGNLAVYDGFLVTAVTSLTLATVENGKNRAGLVFTVASGAVQGRVNQLIANNNSAGYVGLSAEL
jgi:hypothetical protein